jgi:peptidoglycan/xylan/chitin deacetylase (PgdA/CDA1 family)
MLKGAAKALLYRSGSLVALHRARNRHVLTAIMFHRVLSRHDRRFSYCDPEYTMSADAFQRCLDFFEAHYNVVDTEQLLAPAPSLPDYPLIITFDDGWADHEQVALPILANRKLPALVFVAADAVDAPEPRPFWETRIIHAYRRGSLGIGALAELWRASGPDDPPAFADLDQVRALIARLVALDPEEVPPLLAPLEAQLETPHRQLLTQAELLNLPRNGVAVGAHGARHRPLARVADAAKDLQRARADLGARLGEPPPTMSFPHGSYDPAVVDHARATGYRLIFTSDPVLNPVENGGTVPALLGRVGLEEAALTDGRGHFRPELLALRLFRRPRERLTGEPRRRSAPS